MAIVPWKGCAFAIRGIPAWIVPGSSAPKVWLGQGMRRVPTRFIPLRNVQIEANVIISLEGVCAIQDSSAVPANVVRDCCVFLIFDPQALMDSFCTVVTCPNQCNGRGSCVDMAKYATHNVYGLDRVYDTIWDANKIYGCQCDRGFSGADCSMADCPTGDDPLTPNQVNEIQVLVCSATSGVFDLRFHRERVTITYDMTAEAFKAALEVRVLFGSRSISSSPSSLEFEYN